MKQNITQKEFVEKLKGSEEFYDEIFNFGNNDILFPKEIPYSIRFTDCSFTGNSLTLKDINLPEIGLLFESCTFKCKVKVIDSTLNTLWFEDTKEIESLEFNSFSKKNHVINLFRFNYNAKNKDNPKLKTNFSFQNYIFKKDFHFINVNMENGKLDIIGCEIGNKEDIYSKTLLNSSKIHNFFIYNSMFFSQTSFEGTKFYYNSEMLKDQKRKFSSIEESIFEKTSFTNCEFNNIFGIQNCSFNDIINFNNIRNINSGILRIFSSKFNAYTSFDNANLDSIIIYECQFTGILSIQKTKFNKVNITNTIFEKTTFFDDITIRNIFACQRHTIRTIKQQLQLADNKIDYNRFRSYELGAYYKELNTQKSTNIDDKLILWATKKVTGFEHSWLKALRFILLTTFVSFSLFFISENYTLSFSWSGIPIFITGYLRFLIITDFYNPLSNAREYISNDGWNHILSWLIFILGKIVIAFGIYEMIQAFRKFKA